MLSKLPALRALNAPRAYLIVVLTLNAACGGLKCKSALIGKAQHHCDH